MTYSPIDPLTEEGAEKARAALAKIHVERTSWPMTRDNPRAAADGYIHYCATDHETWPCRVAIALGFAA